MTTNTKIAETAQQLEVGSLVTLFVLDATSLGGTVQRFTSTALSTLPITFAGEVYTQIEVEATGFEWSGRGPLPRPTLTVSNVNQVAQAIVRDFRDGVGAKVQRIRTFKQFLDDGPDPDPDAYYPIDEYVIERKAAQNKIFISWELSPIIDQQGRMLPSRLILRDHCTHRYRVWDEAAGVFDFTNATCPYVGVPTFDKDDMASTNAADACSKLLTGCRLRFGQNGELPTRAFPGVGRVRLG